MTKGVVSMLAKNLIVSLESLPLLLTVEEACQILRIGRNAGYELIRCGRLKSIQIGRNIRVPRNALSDFIA